MGKIFKNNLVIAILIILIADTGICYFLLKSRLFSHLAIWNIMESNRESDFYWEPKDCPRYFHFEPDSERLQIFRNDILPLVENERDEFKAMLEVARYVIGRRTGKTAPILLYGNSKSYLVQLRRLDKSSRRSWTKANLSLKWDSPEVMIRQVKEGIDANCFHRAIIFSSYLSTIGVKSRLWALENERFNARSHTINEVYIKDSGRWVFIDTTLGFYVSENARPLSFLEFRKALLNGDNKILINDIENEGKGRDIQRNYKQLIISVFLRTGNDFINKYEKRYGALGIFKGYIDMLPDSLRRGIDYLCGRHDPFIHYVDRYSKNLSGMTFIAKLFFYYLILSPFAIFTLVAINLSKKETRHK